MQNQSPHYPFKLAFNPDVETTSDYPESLTTLFGQDDFNRARDTISSWPSYQPSALHELPGLSDTLKIGKLFYKDESLRFGLGSFKPLGGAYAVTRLLSRILAGQGINDVDAGGLLQGQYSEQISHITVTAATDGNHGRSVAWGAQQCGCRCVIYIHEHVSQQREQAIQNLGAKVIRLSGTYDDSVRHAYQSAQADDWYIIQDTTDGEEIETTLDVMHGYTLLAEESLQQLGTDNYPTHIFLQAGVGGMAAAVLACFWYHLGKQRPISILSEPDSAACCFLSLEAGQPKVAEGELETIMAGLACGEISTLAWEVLKPGAAAAISVNDEAAADCMRLLAESRYGDLPIVAGESAVAGLASLIAVCGDDDARSKLQLDQNSRVLLIGSEGATDPEMYQSIVGKTAAEVLSAS